MPPAFSRDTPALFGETPVIAVAEGVRVSIRLTPRGRADRVEGIVRAADGTVAVKVSVTAPPAEGLANDALMQLLAREWHVARRDLAIVGGLKSRNKIVQVGGDGAALAKRLADAFAALAGS